MSDKDKSLSEMDHLEDLFAAARSEPTPVPKALQAAILADAQQLQHNRAAASDSSRATGPSLQVPQRLWQQFISAVGGWPALGGLAAASLTGLWIGLAPPSFLPDPVESFASYSSGSQLITNLDYDVSFLVSDEVFE